MSRKLEVKKMFNQKYHYVNLVETIDGKSHYITVPAELYKHLPTQPQVGDKLIVDGDSTYRRNRITGTVTTHKVCKPNFKVLGIEELYEDVEDDVACPDVEDIPFDAPVKKQRKSAKK